MRRFSSLKHAPAETRRILRDRFARYLPSQHSTSSRTRKGVTLPDEVLLQLLLSLTIDFESDIARARVTYAAALPPNSSEPSLDELAAAGWFRVVWGRISTPFEVAHAARSATAGTMTAFIALLAKQYEQAYRLTDPPRSGSDLVAVVTAIERGELTPRDIGCQTPEWVAARLWDRPLTKSADLPATLRVWVDRWGQLEYPSLVPGRAWNEAAANTFCETAMHVLEAEPGFFGWDEMRAGFIKQMALVSKQPESNIDGYVPSVPATLVDRALWLDRPGFQHAIHGILYSYADIFSLVGFLLAEVEVEDHAPAPHKLAGRLFELAIERPEVLLTVLRRARWKPELLADLLLHSRTSALACLLIAQWQSSSSAWERELTTRDDRTTKATAFADAASLLGYFLEQRSVNPNEVASLLDWFHKHARPGFIDDLGSDELMLATLRGELAHQSPETLRTMVTTLSTSMPKSGLGTSIFAAALDIIDAGKLARDIDPTPLVTAYIQSVVSGHHTLSANRVSVSGAVSLSELATRTPPELRQRFLYPIDIKAQLAAGPTDNPYTLVDTIARSIRAHIRILSRAVTGWMETAPDDLVDALIVAVRAGALKHDEKGRIAAFSARYESDLFRGPLDRPIASDLGAALAALAGPHRERLLSVILEIDEPLVLAQLLSFAPHAARDRIRQRIGDLTPSEAGSIYTLTDAQARIEALLSAGLADAAAQFIEAERDLKTWGGVAGREMMHLRATLRLQLLRGEWTAISNTKLPPSLPNQHSLEYETITFYKALAELNKPNGDRQMAEQMFAQLQGRRPEVAAYAIDLFVARINLLFGDNSFGQLRGAALVHGRQVLAEAEQMMLHARAVTPSDSEIFNCNKALLLLALGQPDQANELLTSLQASRFGDAAAAYSAVALDRMGRVTEAMTILDQAEQALGGSDVLRAARAHIQSGKGFTANAHVSLEDDSVPRIKVALFDLLQMDHMRQAEVLKSPPEPFDTFVIDHVRSAAASVTSLVPMMKGVDFTSCEDDLTALIRELLVARFEFLGWSVPDQSKGGFTAKGNPGERDLLLQKDSTTLAVIEAVVCNRPVTQEWTHRELTNHFQKLLAYSECRLFFHLTYAYGEDPASITPILHTLAKEAAPTGFRYISSGEIPFTDSRPIGLVARYAGEFGEVKVVFLVLNMGQNHQRQAAKAAERSNPRTRQAPEN